MDSDNDSDTDCPPHIQIPSGFKYCLSPNLLDTIILLGIDFYLNPWILSTQ